GRRRNAIDCLKKRSSSALCSTRSQSSHVSSLSWQYALLLPRCVRPISSPISTIGTPWLTSRSETAFFICRRRSAITSGSSVGPSKPQFQLSLSFEPSLLFSPFASLCFPLYETRSFNVKPSWHVMKLIDAAVLRAAPPYKSGE